MNKREMARIIDHTLLKAFAKKEEIEALCDQAKEYGFASVCVNPVWVPLAAQILKGLNIAVCTVIGFPLGAEKSSVKAFAASQAVLDGADEIDMVINIGAVKDQNYSVVEEEIQGVVEASRAAGMEMGKQVLVKVIVETCYLTDDEIVEACKCAQKCGADFVKTSTGFGTPKDKDGKPLPNGATVHHVALMRKTVGKEMGVKASGGIKNTQDALSLVEAGATRIGASSGIEILKGLS